MDNLYNHHRPVVSVDPVVRHGSKMSIWIHGSMPGLESDWIERRSLVTTSANCPLGRLHPISCQWRSTCRNAVISVAVSPTSTD